MGVAGVGLPGPAVAWARGRSGSGICGDDRLQWQSGGETYRAEQSQWIQGMVDSVVGGDELAPLDQPPSSSWESWQLQYQQHQEQQYEQQYEQHQQQHQQQQQQQQQQQLQQQQMLQGRQLLLRPGLQQQEWEASQQTWAELAPTLPVPQAPFAGCFQSGGGGDCGGAGGGGVSATGTMLVPVAAAEYVLGNGCCGGGGNGTFQAPAGSGGMGGFQPYVPALQTQYYTQYPEMWAPELLPPPAAICNEFYSDSHCSAVAVTTAATAAAAVAAAQSPLPQPAGTAPQEAWEEEEDLEYLDETRIFLRQQEKRYAVDPSYLQRRVGSVGVGARRDLVLGMSELHASVRTAPLPSQESLFLAVNVVDRALASSLLVVSDARELWLLGLAALQLASKYEETSPIAANLVDSNVLRAAQMRLGVTMTRRDVAMWELRVSAAIGFRLSVPTVRTFLVDVQHRSQAPILAAATAAGGVSPAWLGEETAIAEGLCRDALLDATMLQHLPSSVASAAVLLARERMRGEADAWPLELVEVTGYTFGQLWQVSADLRAAEAAAEVARAMASFVEPSGSGYVDFVIGSSDSMISGSGGGSGDYGGSCGRAAASGGGGRFGCFNDYGGGNGGSGGGSGNFMAGSAGERLALCPLAAMGF